MHFAPDLLAKHISELRTCFAERFGAPTGETDASLSRFIHAKKGDVSRAADLLHSYTEFFGAHGHPEVTEIFANLSTQKLLPLGTVAKDGTLVMLFTPRFHDPSAFPAAEMVKLLAWVIDNLSYDGAVQENGLSFVVDGGGAGWGNLCRHTQRAVIDMLQNRMPVRLRAILIANPPTIASVVLTIIKPFLKAKLRDRIHKVDEKGLVELVGEDAVPGERFEGGKAAIDIQKWLERVEQEKAFLTLRQV
jgi:hypothetical protein